MPRWEYDVIRQDSLKGFEYHLKTMGFEGWEAVSANYVMHEPEKTDYGISPARPVWIAVMKRAIENDLTQMRNPATRQAD